MSNFEGTCRFCGQIKSVNAESQEMADKKATEECICDEAENERKRSKLLDNVKRLCGDGAEEFGFRPLLDNNYKLVIDLTNRVFNSEIRKVSLSVEGTIINISAAGEKTKVKKTATTTGSIED